MKPKKRLPKFTSEAQERRFWATHDSTESGHRYCNSNDNALHYAENLVKHEEVLRPSHIASTK